MRQKRICDLEDKMIENKKFQKKKEINNYWMMRREFKK